MGKKQLNLDTFNEILFEALKDQSPAGKRELLINELAAAYGMKIQKMEDVIEDLNNGKPYHENLKLVNNINASCELLESRIEEIEKAHPELVEDEEEV